MQLTDYDYICNMIGSLSGIPVRIYKEDAVVFYYSTVNLVKDPVSISICVKPYRSHTSPESNS